MGLTVPSASALVRIVMVGFLIAFDGESRRELTASLRNYAVGARGVPHPAGMVRPEPKLVLRQVTRSG
jgi:hypothetical protein